MPIIKPARKPFGFIHDIRTMYFTFSDKAWFYPDPGYSKESVKKNGYNFDGQIFFKKGIK